MFRKLLLVLLVVVGLAVVAFAVLLVITPAAPIPEQPPSKPAVERRKAALQADAEGQYVPGYHFVVGPLRFTGFSLKRCLAPLDGGSRHLRPNGLRCGGGGRLSRGDHHRGQHPAAL